MLSKLFGGGSKGSRGETPSTSAERNQRTTSQKPKRRGRPPKGENMSYWRVYVAPALRDKLSAMRSDEGRRLNDILQDMLAAYLKERNKS